MEMFNLKRGFSNEIYPSWRAKQLEKYRDLEPLIRNVLKDSKRVLDIGIGKAWLWSFLEDKGYCFDEITGVDVSEEATEPEKDQIDYIYTDELDLDDEFDLVVAFDSIHLLSYGDRIESFVKNGGYLLQSVPLKFNDKLITPEGTDLIEKGRIGDEEVDFFTLRRKR